MSRSDDHHLNGADVKGTHGALTTYSWDIENRLTVVQMPAGTYTTATFDGDGKRRRYEPS